MGRDDVSATTSGATFVLPQRGGRTPWGGSGTTSLSPELLNQSARRLGILALLYGFTFLMAGFVPPLISELDRARFLEEPSTGHPA